MNVVIIEDEHQAVVALEHELKANCGDLNICGTATNIDDAFQLINRVQPDLIFLDIQLKDGSGFDLLSKFNAYNFKVIFTTAYSEFALKAIKISALDYLLKPIDGEELVEAVSKARKKDKEHQLIHNLMYNQDQNPLRKKIALQTSKGIFLYKIDTIIRLQSESNYTALYLTDKRKIVVSKTLKEFEELLEHIGFIRVHHSHIINLQHLQSYNNKDGGYVIMENNKTIPVSKRKKADLMQVLYSLKT